MKVWELLESTLSGRRKWRHHGHNGFGIRMEVEKEQRIEIVKRLNELFKRRDGVLDGFSELDMSIGWTSPEQASTFPCDIRLVLHKTDPRSNRQHLAGQIVFAALKAAIKKVFKDVLDIDVSVTLESDSDANNLRYIDTKVSWTGRYE